MFVASHKILKDGISCNKFKNILKMHLSKNQEVVR